MGTGEFFLPFSLVNLLAASQSRKFTILNVPFSVMAAFQHGKLQRRGFIAGNPGQVVLLLCDLAYLSDSSGLIASFRNVFFLLLITKMPINKFSSNSLARYENQFPC